MNYKLILINYNSLIVYSLDVVLYNFLLDLISSFIIFFSQNIPLLQIMY